MLTQEAMREQVFREWVWAEESLLNELLKNPTFCEVSLTDLRGLLEEKLNLKKAKTDKIAFSEAQKDHNQLRVLPDFYLLLFNLNKQKQNLGMIVDKPILQFITPISLKMFESSQIRTITTITSLRFSRMHSESKGAHNHMQKGAVNDDPKEEPPMLKFEELLDDLNQNCGNF